MNSGQPVHPGTPEWVLSGDGLYPRVRWSCRMEARLKGIAYAREGGTTLVTDEEGNLRQYDSIGRLLGSTRLESPARQVALSDDGKLAVVITGDLRLHQLSSLLSSIDRRQLPAESTALTISPNGDYLFIGFADGGNWVIDRHLRDWAQFELPRPVAFGEFLTEMPALIVASEHNMLMSIEPSGIKRWDSRTWSNVGGLATTGDGERTYVAGYAMGIQALNESGQNLGSYILEGSVNRVACSYKPYRLIASTLERQLVWLDSDGKILWTTQVPEDVHSLRCDPFGKWILCGLSDGQVLLLEW